MHFYCLNSKHACYLAYFWHFSLTSHLYFFIGIRSLLALKKFIIVKVYSRPTRQGAINFPVVTLLFHFAAFSLILFYSRGLHLWNLVCWEIKIYGTLCSLVALIKKRIPFALEIGLVGKTTSCWSGLPLRAIFRVLVAACADAHADAHAYPIPYHTIISQTTQGSWRL